MEFLVADCEPDAPGPFRAALLAIERPEIRLPTRQAVALRQALGRTVAQFFREVDLWLTPTLSQPPVPIGYISGASDEPGQVMERFGEFLGFRAGSPA